MTADVAPPLVSRLEEPEVNLPRLAGAPNHLGNNKKPVFHFPVKVSLKTDEGLRKHADVKPGSKAMAPTNCGPTKAPAFRLAPTAHRHRWCISPPERRSAWPVI